MRGCREVVICVACYLLAAPSMAGQEAVGPAQGNATAEAPPKHSEVKPAVITLRDKMEKQCEGVSNRPQRLDQVADVGERLVYQARWGGFPAGRITLRVKRRARVRGRFAFVLDLHAESNDFLDVFYRVDSTISSIADVETGMSYLFRRKLHEGRRRVDDRLEFDLTHKGSAGVVEPVAKYSKVEDDRTIRSDPRPIPGPLQDCLSVVYYLRHLAFEEVADEHRVLIGSRKSVDVATFTALRFEELNLGRLGRYSCVVVEPRGSKDTDRTTLVAARDRAEIWLERNTRIPLLIVVKVPIGSISARLIRAEKSPLEKHELSHTGARSEPEHASTEEDGSEGVAPPTPEDF